MPRQSRSRPAPSRTTSTPAAQTRSHTTAAAPSYAPPPASAPPVPSAAAAAPSREPGMLTQMAANMGSVAAGSVIGHGISSMLFGGGSSTPAPAAEPVAQAAPMQQAPISCEVQAKQFTQCLEKADLPSCTWYLEQLKACQAAAAPY